MQVWRDDRLSCWKCIKWPHSRSVLLFCSCERGRWRWGGQWGVNIAPLLQPRLTRSWAITGSFASVPKKVEQNMQVLWMSAPFLAVLWKYRAFDTDFNHILNEVVKARDITWFRNRKHSLVVDFCDPRGEMLETRDQPGVGLHAPRENYPQTPISCKLGVLSAGRTAGCALKWWVASDNRQNESECWALIPSSEVKGDI